MTIRATLFALLALPFCLVACGTPAPGPDYPDPGDPPIEETELYQYVEDDAAEEEVVEDDDWDRPTADEVEAEGSEDDSAE